MRLQLYRHIIVRSTDVKVPADTDGIIFTWRGECVQGLHRAMILHTVGTTYPASVILESGRVIKATVNGGRCLVFNEKQQQDS